MRREFRELLEAGFVVRERGAATALVRSDFADVFDAAGLIECPTAEPDLTPWRPSGGAGPVSGTSPTDRAEEADAAGRRWGVWSALPGGRGPVRILPAGSFGEAVVRPYRRGGLVRHLVRRRYFTGERAFDELAVTERLRRRGVPAPEPLAAVQRAHRLGYAACFVSRRIPGARPASVLLRHAEPRTVEAWMEWIGRSVRRLHAAGGWHADLNAHNVLLRPGPRAGEAAAAGDAAGSGDAVRAVVAGTLARGEDGAEGGPARTVPDLPVLIDFDRGRAEDRPIRGRRARSNLARLRRSLEKLEIGVALEAWPCLERGYEEEGHTGG